MKMKNRKFMGALGITKNIIVTKIIYLQYLLTKILQMKSYISETISFSSHLVSIVNKI